MSELTALLIDCPEHFHNVVPFDAEKDKLILLDFTVNNRELIGPIIGNTQQFTDYINGKLGASGAKYGIGGYNEYRELYKRSTVFDSEQLGEEPRRLHLGIDIWGKPYTAVMSPLNAVVHSFAFNNDFGDYGATLILTHNIGGLSFHTLYGHLSLNSIKNLREGENVKKGDVIGEFGIQMENGQWPPHLHFQIIQDLAVPVPIARKGDYPGVCKMSESETYLANCPNPDLILNMIRYASNI